MSCAPRAFEIENFLSDAEVDHILHLAHITPLKLSTTGSANDSLAANAKSDTRTSRNTWIDREKDLGMPSKYPLFVPVSLNNNGIFLSMIY